MRSGRQMCQNTGNEGGELSLARIAQCGAGQSANFGPECREAQPRVEGVEGVRGGKRE